MVSATTRDILVSVETSFIEEQSSHEEEYYVWAYRITIANKSAESVQLLTRHWKISDEHGHVQEVQGDGVVGQQPVIDQGDSFTYSSGTPLQTPSGFMHGSYQMRGPDGTKFDIEIPAFSLDCPYQTPQVH